MRKWSHPHQSNKRPDDPKTETDTPVRGARRWRDLRVDTLIICSSWVWCSLPLEISSIKPTFSFVCSFLAVSNLFWKYSTTAWLWRSSASSSRIRRLWSSFKFNVRLVISPEKLWEYYHCNIESQTHSAQFSGTSLWARSLIMAEEYYMMLTAMPQRRIRACPGCQSCYLASSGRRYDGDKSRMSKVENVIKSW